MAHGHEYDAIHASPPCQKYSLSAMQHRLKGKIYPDLISATREALVLSGRPYVIENVPGAPLINPITLCGSMFQAANGGILRTYRHRLFESNIPLTAPKCEHKWPNAKMGRRPKEGEFVQYVGHFSGVQLVRDMTGLYWMNQYSLAQSIPPQYTKFIGDQLMAYLTRCSGISHKPLTGNIIAHNFAP